MPFKIPTLETLRTRLRGDLETAIPGVRAGGGTVAQTLADAAAGMGRGLFLQQQTAAQDLFPDTAKGEILERWAGIWGIRRTAATKALGGAVFKGTAGLSIPKNLELQSTSGQRYRTSQSGVLSAQGTATITAQAVQGGVKGNASAGALLTLASTVIGVSPTAKVVQGGLVGGAAQELDDALRTRVLGRIRAQERIGTKGDYHAWTLAVGGVDRAWVFPLYGGEAGVVAVFITVPAVAGNPQASAAKITQVKAALAALHPASTVLRVFTPTLLPVAVRATITPFTQATQNAVRTELTTAFHSAPSPGKALPLSTISTAFSRVGGLVSWTLTQPRAATQPAAGVLPVLGELTLGAANG